MRCKNCGSENEDGRYICQNCGSPLYDENDEFIDNGEYDEYNDEDYDKKATKKSIIIIVVLVVILIAIITGVVFAVSGGSSKNPDTSESEDIGVSEDYSEFSNENTFENTVEQTTEPTTEKTTEKTTGKTTAATTEKTTAKTTEKSTEAKFYVYVDIDGDGNILGEGEYSKGKKVTLVATADPGAQFVGWYENGIIVASGTKYSFTVDKERHLTAVFQRIPEEGTDIESGENQ